MEYEKQVTPMGTESLIAFWKLDPILSEGTVVSSLEQPPVTFERIIKEGNLDAIHHLSRPYKP